MNEKIAMHCHIKEQKEPFRDFLLECKNSGVTIVSITDHRTLNAYTDKISKLSLEDLEKFKDIKFAIGIELTGSFEYINIYNKKSKILVDVLGYNLDLKKAEGIDKFIKEKYISTDNKNFQQTELIRLISVAKSLGFKADFDKMKITDENRFAGRILSQELIEKEYVDYNIKKGLSMEIKENPFVFNNKYCKNPDSPFYIDMTKYFPKIDEVLNLIHECGGLTFLAHAAVYSIKAGNEEEVMLGWEDSKTFTNQFVKKYINELDGLEIIHHSYMKNHDFISFLKNIAKENNLYVSGGTDYHLPGDKLCTDFENIPITYSRLPRIKEWIKTYTLKEIKEMVNKK